jgi:superfamily I DNA/RNA helicase
MVGINLLKGSIFRVKAFTFSAESDRQVIQCFTVHGCKGDEYDNVVLGSDLSATVNVNNINENIPIQELNALYTAISRAMKCVVLNQDMNILMKKVCNKLLLYKTEQREYVADMKVTSSNKKPILIDDVMRENVSAALDVKNQKECFSIIMGHKKRGYSSIK